MFGDYADELRDVAGRAAGADVLAAVDEEGGEVLGGVTYVPGPSSPAAEFAEADAAGIRMLAVAPSARRRGVGEALTVACIEHAQAAGRPRPAPPPISWPTPTASTSGWGSCATPRSTGRVSRACGCAASACSSTRSPDGDGCTTPTALRWATLDRAGEAAVR